ncbi:MAG: hypothetical protein HQL46_09565 [Gammaproteobacteria bacterium]|nr:hypothetical protein [Gammaproteobacteria bacterium]
MNKFKLTQGLLISSLPLLLLSCTGSGSSDSDSTTNNDSTNIITGLVPGTLIEAFCADGSYYKTNSIDNNTAEHPFSLSIPSGIDCRLVMTTNEDNPVTRIITPINFSASGTESGLINLTNNLDIGYVPLELEITNIVDENSDNVVDSPLTIALSLPSGVTIKSVSYDLLDEDGDGIPNVYEDDDQDGIHNSDDDDDDNNGISDDDEPDNKDNDHDGIEDSYDKDDNNDGLKDEEDNEDNKDGLKDEDDNSIDDINKTENDGEDEVNKDEDEKDEDEKDEDENSEGNKSDEVNQEEEQNNPDTSETTQLQAVSYEVISGRLLASQCAQCHGTNGHSVTEWDSLAGESANEIIEEMREMKAGDEDPLMQAQAHGYSDEEIEALANWFATQSSNSHDD